MSAAASNPAQQTSRARKKKAKSEVPTQSVPAPPEAEAQSGSADAVTNGSDGAYESPYIKELYKYVCLHT